MAYDADNVQGNFDKFVESMYQYLNEPIKNFATIKPQLLNIFKTHRPIKTSDYQYGISKSLKGKTQLIVHEFSNDRSMVREYFKSGKDLWQCCECNRTKATKSDDIADLLVKHEIVFVKLKHDCLPRQFSFVQNIQKFYLENKVQEADALQKSVLGSKDLKFAYSKPKKTVSKREIKVAARHAMDAEIADAIKLQYSQRENEDQEELPSVSDESQEKLTPKAAFSKIINNLKEYTKETKKSVVANKTKLLFILKSHRPIKIGKYEYGLSETLKVNKRLVVFEWNDKKRVREYTNRNDSKNLWICRECFRQYQQKMITSYWDLFVVNGIVFVPYEHACKPADYAIVTVYQKYLEEGNIQMARRMRQKINFESSLTNTVDGLDTSSQTIPTESRKEVNNNQNNTKTLTRSKRRIKKSVDENDNSGNEESASGKILRTTRSGLKYAVMESSDGVTSDDKEDGNDSSDEEPPVKKSKFNESDSNDTVMESSAEMEEEATSDEEIYYGSSDEEIPVHKRSKLNESDSSDTVIESSTEVEEGPLESTSVNHFEEHSTTKTALDHTVTDEDHHPEIEQTSENSVEIEATIATTPSLYHFEKPSTSKLQEICGKLNIEYHNKAAKLWDEIMFNQIDTVTPSTNIKTHYFETENIYQILSIFFTGKSEQHEQIKNTIIDAFREKLVSSGEMTTKKFNKKYSDDVTDEHFAFMAKYLSCRILIIDGENGIRKYGKWKSTTSIRITLVVVLINGNYSIVFNL